MLRACLYFYLCHCEFNLERFSEVMDPEDPWVTEYEDLDRGAEYIEDLILSRAAKLRANWLLFDSFKKIHTEAQLKLKFEVFERIGSEFGHELRKFATFEEHRPNTFICREGEWHCKCVFHILCPLCEI